jgi:hypothetical protein
MQRLHNIEFQTFLVVLEANSVSRGVESWNGIIHVHGTVMYRTHHRLLLQSILS